MTALAKWIPERWRNPLRADWWTRFRREATPEHPAHLDDDDFWVASPNWGLLAGEVFEDKERVVVRLEAPGMDLGDFDLQVEGDLLRVRGEKRSERETGEGAWRLRERAYGAFERAIRLPAQVKVDKARATYRRGVLRIELPKAQAKAPRRVAVKVQ